jgi:hypothetical protein
MLQSLEKVVYTHNLLMDGGSHPFYVGIGDMTRAKYLHRNAYHANVVAKYGKDRVRVVVWETGLSMEEAAKKEIELIAFLKEEGARLTNLTVGGDGTTGYKWSLAQRAKKSGKNHPQFGKPQSAESNAKRSSTLAGVWETTPHPHLGRVEPAGKKELRLNKVRASWTPEKRKRASTMFTGAGNPFAGKNHTDETRRHLSDVRKGKPFRTKESYAASGALVRNSRWLTDGTTSKRLYSPDIEAFLAIGWVFGKMDKRKGCK